MVLDLRKIRQKLQMLPYEKNHPAFCGRSHQNGCTVPALEVGDAPRTSVPTITYGCGMGVSVMKFKRN